MILVSKIRNQVSCTNVLWCKAIYNAKQKIQAYKLDKAISYSYYSRKGKLNLKRNSISCSQNTIF